MKKRIFSMLLMVCMVFTMCPTAAFATEDSITPPAEDCDCTVKCIAADEANEIEAAIKADCPVCGVEGADLARCKGEALAPLKAPRASDTVYDNLGAAGNETNITATLSGGTLAITGSGAMKDWTQETDVPWNFVKGTITTVTIAEGITNIGNNAFWGCTALESVTIAEGVTTINSYAFALCIALKSITIQRDNCPLLG